MTVQLRTAFFLLILVVFISGCGQGAAEMPTSTATSAPSTTTQPSPTLTPTATTTPIPTETLTPQPTDTLAPTVTLSLTEEPYEVIGDLSYVPEGEPDQKLSLYIPNEGKRKELSLLLPGGQYFPELVGYFIELGYPVISFNTRNDSYRAEIQDGFCALAWVHANAETYGLDADQIVPVGGSMWGGNAALLGLVEEPATFLEECPHTLPASGGIRAVITLAGVFDYSEEQDFFAGFIHNISTYMGGTPDEVPENWASASAITWVKGAAPPFLLVHGTADTNVAAAQSEKFAAALEEASTSVDLVLLPGVNHSTSVTDARVFEAMESFLVGLEGTSRSIGSGEGLIAYNSERDGNTDIYVMNTDGSQQRRLTDDPAYDAWPSWSPDGAQIAFVSDRAGNPDIYVMDADGGNVRQLTQHSENDIWPAWSPDGTRIAFPSRRDGNFEIYVMEVDGSSLERLTNTSSAEDFPTWSLDGSLILFSRIGEDQGTYVINPDGSGERQLLDFPVLEPAWSPDGLRIAFGSDHEGFRGIYIMNANGENLQRLSSTHYGENCPDWSPDGEQLTFASWRDGDGEIYIMDADGSNLHQLTEDEFEDEFPAWQPGPALTNQ